MSPEEQRKALLERERARLEGEEREKRLLHDRTVGGPMVPRPSRDFIEKNTGPLRSQEEIARLAEQRADRQMQDTQRERARADAFAKSADAHNKRLEEKQERAKDYWGKPAPAEHRPQQPDYWNERAKLPAQEKAPKRERDWERDRDR